MTLDKPPIAASNDTINRQSAIKAINKMIDESKSDYVKSILRNVRTIIGDLPSDIRKEVREEEDIPIEYFESGGM